MANTSTTKATSITKQEAVERALKEKGWDAKPVDLKPFIKERYGLDMTAEHITTCKSKARKGKPPAKKQPAPKAPSQPAPQQPAKAVASRTGNGRSAGFSLEDIQAVKGLIGRVGAGPLRSLIDLLSR
jgi:hypothetical protein